MEGGAEGWDEGKQAHGRIVNASLGSVGSLMMVAAVPCRTVVPFSFMRCNDDVSASEEAPRTELSRGLNDLCETWNQWAGACIEIDGNATAPVGGQRSASQVMASVPRP